MHAVLELIPRLREVARGQRVALAVDVDRLREAATVAVVDWLAAGVRQEAPRAAIRAVAPQPEDIERPQARRQFVGQLQLRLILDGVVLRAAAEQQPRLIGAVQAWHRACHRRGGRIGGRAAHGPVRESLRLALAVGATGVQPPRKRALGAADRGTGLLRVVAPPRAVQAIGLMAVANPRVRFEARGHAGLVVDHRAHRVARIRRRERPVHHVDAADLLGRHQPPARREGGAIAEQVGQQDAVRIDQRTRAVAGAGRARGQHRVVVVADVALAHQQAGQVLERVLGVGRVDVAGDVLARNALHRRGDTAGEGGRRGAIDPDDAEGRGTQFGVVDSVGAGGRGATHSVVCRGGGGAGARKQGKHADLQAARTEMSLHEGTPTE